MRVSNTEKRKTERNVHGLAKYELECTGNLGSQKS